VLPENRRMRRLVRRLCGVLAGLILAALAVFLFLRECSHARWQGDATEQRLKAEVFERPEPGSTSRFAWPEEREARLRDVFAQPWTADAVRELFDLILAPVVNDDSPHEFQKTYLLNLLAYVHSRQKDTEVALAIEQGFD